MKMVLVLQFLIEIAQQRIIEVNNGPASTANEMMMGCPLYRFVVKLLSWQVNFSYQSQFAQ